MGYNVPDCECCCDEHTFVGCPAMPYGHCKGYETNTIYNDREWFEHYAKYHNMSEWDFYNQEIYFNSYIEVETNQTKE